MPINSDQFFDSHKLCDSICIDVLGWRCMLITHSAKFNDQFLSSHKLHGNLCIDMLR